MQDNAAAAKKSVSLLYILLMALGSFVISFLTRFSIEILSIRLLFSLSDIVLYPAALLLSPFAGWCVCVLPVLAVEAIAGNLIWIPCVLLVKTVTFLAMHYVMSGVLGLQSTRSIVPFLTHGVCMILGVFLFNVVAYGLLTAAPGLLVSIVEWNVAGGLGMLLIRMVLRRPAFMQSYVAGRGAA